jgi:hypothetical protein
VRAVLRSRLTERLLREAMARNQAGRAVAELRMAAAQVGDLTGVAELAHGAGELMVFVRSGDAATLRAAIVLCDGVRARLDQIAASDGGVDTARLVMPPRLPPPPGAVATAVDDDDPSASAQPRVIRDAPTPRERRS